MNEVKSPTSPEVRSSKLQVLLQWLDSKLKPVHGALLTVVGVDGESLARAPRSEQVVWPAVGLYMVVMAWVTGGLLALKVGRSLAVGWWTLPPLWLIASTIVLLIEIMILGTVKNGTRNNVMLRIALSCVLVGVQTMALLTWSFRDQIALHNHDQVIAAHSQAKSSAESIHGIKQVAQQGIELLKAEADAKKELANPTPTMQVNESKAQLEKAGLAVLAATKAVDEARRRLAEARARLALERADSPRREAIERAISYWTAQVGTKQKAMNDAEAERSNAEADHNGVLKTWRASLQAALDRAQAQVESHSQVEQKTKGSVDKIVGTAVALATDAGKESFFNDVRVLLSMLPSHPSLLLACVFSLLIAIVLDLVPLIVKINLSRGVVAKLEEQIVTVTNLETESASCEATNRARIRQIESDNELAAVKLFADTDQGSTRAAIMAREAGIKRDEYAVTHGPRVIQSGLVAIHASLLKAQELDQMAKGDPVIEPLFRSQLKDLIAKLEKAERFYAPTPTQPDTA